MTVQASTDLLAAPFDLLAAHWPAVAERLGGRQEAFLASAAQSAARHGLVDALSQARYLNLCFAFGPGFELKPQHEWALALLADERLQPLVKLHQVLHRARAELQRSGGDAATLLRADTRLLDDADAALQAQDRDAAPLPRQACDIEALELRVLDSDWRHEYRLLGGQWQRVPGPAVPPALRITAEQPAPERLHLLTHAAGQGPLARLQLRQALHAVCGERHPAARWLSAEGLSQWHGHEAKAVSWPVGSLAATPPALGLALVEESSPAVHLLQVPSCGLRDMGVPLGPQALQVWAWPADQWLWVMQREPAIESQWPAEGAAPAPALPSSPNPAPTRCRIERDGQPVDARGWVAGFDQQLAQAWQQAMQALFNAWAPSAQQPTLRATPGLLTGRAALTWGWREGSAGLAAEPVLRVAGELDLTCSLALTLEGEMDLGGSRARVQLQAEGSSPLQQPLLRDTPRPALMETVMPLATELRLPFTLTVDPIAHDDGLVWREAGPCTGALTLQAGLRPRLSGGSGWQWFVRAALEPVMAPLVLHDPLLGLTHRQLALLPALPLIDWSLG